MRWITFLVLLYLMTAFQVTNFGGIPSKSGIWPHVEYLPLLAIFYALFAADTAAPLAALVCGLAYDLMPTSGAFIGTNLVPLALVGWLILRIRLSIFREHFVSQMVVTLLAVLAFALLSAIFRVLMGAPLEGTFWAHWSYIAGNAVYTAIVALFIFFVFFRYQNLLGFTSHGPRNRSHG